MYLFIYLKLMKYGILTLLFFLSFVGCKNDTQPEPDTGVVYEDWEKVSSDVINLNSRNVIAMEAYDQNLYIKCLSSYYQLDSNLKRVGQYLIGLEKEPWSRKPAVIGRSYTINKSEGYAGLFGYAGFEIKTTNNPFDEQYVLWIDSLGSYASGGIYSGVDDDGQFSILYSTHFADSIDYYLGKYKLKFHEEVEELDKVSLGRGPTNGGVSDVSIIDGIAYCSYFNKMSRIEAGKVTHEFLFNLRDVTKYQNAIIGIADNTWRGQADEPQLLISYDNGVSWTSVMKGRSLNSGNLKVVGDEILLVRGSSVLVLDIENGTFKEVDMAGTDAYFKDVTKLGNRAILGTRSGVYYKSWESFLNK